MKKIISFLFLIISISVFSQVKLTAKNILDKEMVYTFEGGAIIMKISSDTTLYWRNDSQAKEAIEQSKTTHIDEHRILTAWYEADKTFVTLLSDFEKLKVSGMVCRPDGKFYPINGTIEVKL